MSRHPINSLFYGMKQKKCNFLDPLPDFYFYKFNEVNVHVL